MVIVTTPVVMVISMVTVTKRSLCPSGHAISMLPASELYSHSTLIAELFLSGSVIGAENSVTTMGL